MKKIFVAVLILLSLLLTACGMRPAPGEAAASMAAVENAMTASSFLPDIEAALAAALAKATEPPPFHPVQSSTAPPPYTREADTTAATSAAMRTTAATAAATAKSEKSKAAARYVYTNSTAAAKTSTAQQTAASASKTAMSTGIAVGSTASRTTAAPAAPAATASTATTKPIAAAAAPDAQASVRFSIDGSAAAPHGYNVTLPTQIMRLNEGESVLDLLQKSGLAVASTGSGRMAYVRGIGGLLEKDCGGSSGWVYEVNGARPPVSCGMYQPKSGDEIVWRYSLAV